MGKSRRGYKEYTREQKLINENKKLKRDLSVLRKQIARIDLDRYDSVKTIIQEHYAAENKESEGEYILENLRNAWRCHSCVDGVLEIAIYTRAGEEYYFRQCNCCENRTKSQKYTPSVKGIIKISK